jgi:predicted phosphodiesterase
VTGIGTIGVIADTHIPDRLRKLPDGLLPGLTAARVSLILHAGDIISPLVLDLLGEVAPVIAVKGNRDWALKLPLIHTLDLYGVKVGLTHGHGGLIPYLLDKIRHIRHGYQFERYQDHLLATFTPQSITAAPCPGGNLSRLKVIVYGHTHVPELRWENDILFFNPGAAIACLQNGFKPRYGLLRFYEGGRVEGEIIAC